MNKKQNDSILKDTLEIAHQAYCKIDNADIIRLKCSREQMAKALFLAPETVYDMLAKQSEMVMLENPCRIYVAEKDSLEAAHDMLNGASGESNVCVLNFANPVTPGGGVRRGARAQEETLCLRSSLLASLESSEAVAYYEYNKKCSFRGSDAVILSPYVSVFKDCNYNLLQRDFVVSVLTCAAPLVSPYSHCLEDVTGEQMEGILYLRILGILSVAKYYRYQRLVLGAWGCGAFGNDAKVISRLFKEALKEVNADAHFEEVCFAILANYDSYNLNCFRECFEEK